MTKIPTGYRRLDNSERKPVAGARMIGPADPKEKLTVTISVRRRPDAPPLPDPTDRSTTPAGERRFLSREEFAEHYGASQEDLDKIAAFGAKQGLTVVEASIPKRSVVLSGTAEQMGRAFAVELGRYESEKGAYRGREGHVHVPEDLAPIVEGVFGLDNRKMAEPQIMRVPRAKEALTQAAAAQAAVPLTPPEVAGLYQFPATNANGQTIGLFEFDGGYRLSDIQAYFNQLHLPAPSVTWVGVDGQTNAPGMSDADGEVILDIDVAAGAAPGAKIVVYFAPWTEQGWLDIVSAAIHDVNNRPSVISISWGWPEHQTALGFTWTDAALQAVNQKFWEAALLGVTVLAASGDHGSDCGIGDRKAHVLYPASDPYVTACGGTVISNVSGASFQENTWRDDSDWLTAGGVSDYFPKPIWQDWANIPTSANDGHAGRAIPDIAGNASQLSGYDLILGGRPTGPIGGTSATAPLYAALVALLNADLGEPVGYLNPNLYAFQGPYVYRDIADNVNNTRGGAPGYPAIAGWDACTGLGGVNGVALLTALRGVGLPPALAVFNNKLYMVWKGMERDDRVFYSFFDGLHWAPQQEVPGIGSSTGVALAVFHNRLCMAWKGVLGDERIFWTAFDGTHWAHQRQVPGVSTSTGPRLAVFNNRLYMAWKGVMGDQRIFWTTFDGSRWARQRFVPGVATSVGPALAVCHNMLYMAWKGWYGDQGVYWSYHTGAGWAPQQKIAGIGSSEGPSLTVFNNMLYALWKGALGDQRLWYSHLDAGAWAPQKMISGVAGSVGPGAAVFGPALFAAWKGMLGDERIFFSHFDGTAWAPQEQVQGVLTSPDLVEAAVV
ncbi:MAG TPA: S53 family peptidase [Bryobacteraceae bacterium]|nr:S53 family peptidase [Bryobacteraceae bacterium]